MKDYVIHLENPAKTWEKPASVSNGVLGLSMLERQNDEKLVLNEETVCDESGAYLLL